MKIVVYYIVIWHKESSKQQIYNQWHSVEDQIMKISF